MSAIERQLPTLLLVIVLTVQMIHSAPYSKDSKSKSKLNLEVESATMSPKLVAFYERLYDAEPDTMAAGLIKFRKVLFGSKTSDDFLEKISRGEDEQGQAKAYLAELIQHLQADYPEILNWLLSTTYGDNHAVTAAQLDFLEAFSTYDKEMSQHDVWNQYWRYLFRMIADFIVNSR